ncbi:MAG: hypothetical protein ACI85O_000815 [Saprospiraceae bacterium]|jgi:hypothetical protein
MHNSSVQKYIVRYRLKEPIYHKVKIYLSANSPGKSRSFPEIKGYLLETESPFLLIKRGFSIIGLMYLIYLPFHISKRDKKIRLLKVSDTALKVLHSEKGVRKTARTRNLGFCLGIYA